MSETLIMSTLNQSDPMRDALDDAKRLGVHPIAKVMVEDSKVTAVIVKVGKRSYYFHRTVGASGRLEPTMNHEDGQGWSRDVWTVPYDGWEESL